MSVAGISTMASRSSGSTSLPITAAPDEHLQRRIGQARQAGREDIPERLREPGAFEVQRNELLDVERVPVRELDDFSGNVRGRKHGARDRLELRRDFLGGQRLEPEMRQAAGALELDEHGPEWVPPMELVRPR